MSTTTTQAIQMQRTGEAAVLQWSSITLAAPSAGQALVEIRAAGVNYIDVYQRTGMYAVQLPYCPGLEGAGVVQAVGAGVEAVAVGDRVAWCGPSGSYARHALLPADRLVRVPEAVSFEDAAAVMLQGMTAHYLCTDAKPVAKGDVVLVHAGAGGTGLLLIQLCRQRGATVLATVSTAEKAALAKAAGAEHAILYTEVDFQTEIERLVGKKALAAVFDSVGKTTFDQGLELLKPRGMMVLYGQSSGLVSSFDLGRLNALGSLFITRPGLFHYIGSREELLGRADFLWRQLAEKKLALRIGHRFSLAEAAAAHEAITGRGTTGKLLLMP